MPLGDGETENSKDPLGTYWQRLQGTCGDPRSSYAFKRHNLAQPIKPADVEQNYLMPNSGRYRECGMIQMERVWDDSEYEKGGLVPDRTHEIVNLFLLN